MKRIETAVKVLRHVAANYDKLYTFEQVTASLEQLELGYKIVEDVEGIHLIPDLDENLTIHFTYENNQYKISSFNILHSLLNELNIYFNEIDVSDYVSQFDLDICLKELELLETIGMPSWEDKLVAVDKVLSIFNEDKLVATLLFLKFIGGNDNRRISYMERHYVPIEYRGFVAKKYVELYNVKYHCMVTIDILNCNVIEDEYDLIVNSFKKWKKQLV